MRQPLRSQIRFRPFFHFTKSSEGGMTQRVVKQIADSLGIAIKIGPSPYVGKYLVYVGTQNKRTLARFERQLW